MCILKVLIRDGVIISCEPDDTINPGILREDNCLSERVINAGMIQTRPCVKGYVQTNIIYDPNRVKYPMKRVGNRGEGKFQRISWDEALDTITQKLLDTKNNFGPYSLLHHPYSMFGGCSFPLASWLGMGVSGWGSHSDMGWLEPIQWVLGIDFAKSLKQGKGLELAQDELNIFESKLIVFWGFNPVTTLDGAWTYNLLRAKERGIPVICIEPRYSPTVELLADQWIPIKPGTDVAMMIAIANVWFKEGLCDEDFIRKWIEPEGLKKWQNYVLGIEDGLDKTPQWAEEICGVPAETIEAFARLYAKSKPVNLNVSLSLGRQYFGENSSRAAMYLQALTGNMGIPGGTAAAETGLFLGQPALSNPKIDWQRTPGKYTPPVLLCMHKWPKAVDLRNKVDSGQISQEEYNNIIGNKEGNPSPNIQMVILESNNHLNSLPDINTTIRAMKKLDFIVVSTQYTDMPTARYADIILPFIYTAYEGRNCAGVAMKTDLFRHGVNLANFMMYCQKCIDPVGEVKSVDWIWTQIAKRLEIVDLYNPRMASVQNDEWDQTIEAFHKEAYEKWAVSDDIVQLNPPNWVDFQNRPVFRYEIKDHYYAFKNELSNGENLFSGTDSGKMEFYSKLINKGADFLATNDYPSGSGRCYGRGEFTPMAQMQSGGKDNFNSTDVSEYPLLMLSPHSHFRVHSYLDNNPLLREDCYRHAVWINVLDAEARKIQDNDKVKIYNDIGEMILPAYVTSKVVPGTVCVFHGGWYRPNEDKTDVMPDGVDVGGSPNMLIHSEDVPDRIIGVFPCQALVQIEKSDRENS
jgi:anaerobic dimethyl sulfoxide reductase subunit A